jgi:sigma-B regulation protein RsbU (phosphoserine phosphatase)
LSDPPRAIVEDLEDLYENAPCGYLSLDPNARIAKANATLAEWLYRPADQLVGKRFHDLMTIAGRMFFETHLAPLLRMHGQFNEVALDLLTADGTKFPVLASAKERRDAEGKLQFSRITVFSATERRRYERDLVDARVAAELAKDKSDAESRTVLASLKSERETSELREQFIAVLGHDLRNPLAAIEGGARLLAREPQSEKASSILALMSGSTQRMASLIDNVLDFARGRLGGGLTLSLRPADLEPLLVQVVDELRSGASGRVIETDVYLPDLIMCDPGRIGQLVSNLVGNAITHGSDARPVQVSAKVRSGVFNLSVSNAGAPIPTAVMERLFQPFFRGEVRPSQQGLGLGLYIAWEIARAHGGELTVESSVEQTRFVFSLPPKPTWSPLD